MPETLQPSHGLSFAVELAGDIDLANAATIGDDLCQTISRAENGMVVDLSNVTCMDSCAIAMMIRVHKHADSLGKSVHWQGAQVDQLRVFQIVAVDKALNLAE